MHHHEFLIVVTLVVLVLANSNSISTTIADELTLIIRPEKGPNFLLSAKPTETSSQLRQRISQQVRKPLSSFRVMANTLELKDGDKTLRDLRVYNYQNLFVKGKESLSAEPGKSGPGPIVVSPPRPERFEDRTEEFSMRSLVLETVQLMLRGFGFRDLPLPYIRPHDLSSSATAAASNKPKLDFVYPREHPKRIVASEHFELLYRLLDAPGDIGRSVWELLNLLPANESMLQKLSQVKELEQNWPTLFDSRSIYKLSYTLQVVVELMRKQREDGTGDEWCERFVSLGGVSHLLTTFMEIDENQAGGGHAACYEMLLRIINFVLQPSKRARGLVASTHSGPMSLVSSGAIERTVQQVECLKGIDIQRLVQKLLDVARVCATRDADSSRIVKQATELLIICVNSSHDMLEFLFTYQHLNEWILASLFQSPHKKVRQQTALGIHRLCSEVELLYVQCRVARLLMSNLHIRLTRTRSQ